jgi:hypothetical protein
MADLINYAKGAHEAYVAGTISQQRFAECADVLCGYLNVSLGKLYDTAPGKELIKPGRSPLSPEQNYRLAKQEFALAKLRKNPDGEEIAKAAPVEKSSALRKLERMAMSAAQDCEGDYYAEFAKVCSTPEGVALLAEDSQERLAKASRPGEEHPAVETVPTRPRSQDAITTKLIAGAHAYRSAQAVKGKKITLESALDHVASGWYRSQKHDRRNGQDVEPPAQ